MRLELIIDPSRIKRCYGDIPDTHDAPVEAYECFQSDFEANDYGELFDLEFVEPVDSLCHSLLERGDVDYLEADQCRLLAQWLEERTKEPCPYPLNVFFPKLLDYAQRAAALGTGIVLDL